jgi:hypothetical protein
VLSTGSRHGQLCAAAKAAWISRAVRAGVPLLGEPLFRWLVSHCDVIR